MEETGPSVTMQILVLILLTTINAFFAASEMAMVSVDKKKLSNMAEDGNRRAKTLLKLLSEPSRFLSTIQVGITLAGFFAAGSASRGLSEDLGKFLGDFGIPYATNISFLSVTIILAFFNLVFGELVPKRIALLNAEKFSILAIPFVSLVAKFMKPFVWLLSATTNGVLRILGQKTEGVEEKVTLEEIKSMVEVGQEQGVINPVEREMIDSVIGFDDKLAEDIMTARTEVFMIDADSEVDEYIGEMMELKYSRIPVYEDDIDNIIGILYIKDYLKEAFIHGFENVDIRKILKPAYFVPERKNINDLFLELQEGKKHMAILIDEYGGFSGIVTMEDLIEEIMGDIDDEYDHDEPDIKIIDPQTFHVKGSVSIKELNSKVGSKFDEDTEDYDTLGGLLIFHLGYIPSDGETQTLVIDRINFYIEEVKDKRIQFVKITLPEDFGDEEVNKKD
ncbi:hemolysin family protein [Miniphocaeibacter massiliensis]|uniref:hemolysin family protein n=1 Tax=Miniphocaeibacter massiliensis TaxID=2041841 RepID=UPI000C07CA42|nr:hemolysin family protein [Miniphocaeibacter massiliensis]